MTDEREITYRVLRVDMTRGTVEHESLEENLYRSYIGGWNVILHTMLREIPRGADPLSADNVLVFAAGALTGTPIGCSGRNSAGAKSPLTGGCALSEAGGFFGAELRRAGFDAVVVTGSSEKPVYLTIVDGRAALRPAEHLWGLTTGQAHAIMCEESGQRRARTALIGPAGENEVPIACVLNDLSHAYGRGGLGAVMGSKRLKGILASGGSRENRPRWADPDALRDLGRWMSSTWRQATPTSEFFSEHGTLGFLAALDAGGALPTENFLKGSFEGAASITGETLTETYLEGTGTCFGCPISCKREVGMESPHAVQSRYGGPEYETGASFGSDCGVSEIETIIKANELCNAYGLDTISAGASIAWAMECYEAGLLDRGETDGLELAFGSSEAVLELVEKMARREGFGAVLGAGAARAAESLGKGRERAMHVKGQDLPMHEPRVKHGLGLSYAVSPTGADHIHAIHDVSYVNPTPRMRQLGLLEGVPALELSPAKVRLSLYEILLNTLYNDLVLCNAPRIPFRFDIRKVEQAVRGATGWDMTSWELMKAAERSLTMARVFNLREGLGPEDDVLPSRFFESLEGSPGSRPLERERLPEAVSLFYEMLGWDGRRGVPTRGKLEELGIGWAWEHIREL